MSEDSNEIWILHVLFPKDRFTDFVKAAVSPTTAGHPADAKNCLQLAIVIAEDCIRPINTKEIRFCSRTWSRNVCINSSEKFLANLFHHVSSHAREESVYDSLVIDVVPIEGNVLLCQGDIYIIFHSP